ncbi:hypothetical protein CLOM621_06595 [Clostridium sp. M62/1]|nr:hypothetical protein CLOM621_06595 [Clostridium sp. M62/1]
MRLTLQHLTKIEHYALYYKSSQKVIQPKAAIIFNLKRLYTRTAKQRTGPIAGSLSLCYTVLTKAYIPHIGPFPQAQALFSFLSEHQKIYAFPTIIQEQKVFWLQQMHMLLSA